VFADKDLGRKKPVKADFVGITVPNRYVFGFGMDAYGLWRNLPAIYALKGMIAIIGAAASPSSTTSRSPRGASCARPMASLGPLTFGHIGANEAVFLARHGYGHTLAPHEVNYRANLWALQAQGVTRVIAVAPWAASPRTWARATSRCPTRSSTTPGDARRPSSRARSSR
jgi:hypothetical protein